MRKDLLTVIFKAKDQAKLIDLPIASSVKKTISELFDLQFKILEYLTNTGDYATATVKNKITDFAVNIAAMIKSEAILLDSDMQIKFQKMKELMKPIYNKLPIDLKTEFAGKMNMN